MSKHTPQWYVANMGNDHQGLVVDEATGHNIAVAYDRKDTPMLAAAPAMYLELKEGLVLLEASHHDMVDMYGIDSLQAKTVWERIESTRTALAQAEGSKP